MILINSKMIFFSFLIIPKALEDVQAISRPKTKNQSSDEDSLNVWLNHVLELPPNVFEKFLEFYTEYCNKSYVLLSFFEKSDVSDTHFFFIYQRSS